MKDDTGLPLPPVRCLTKEQAAAYLGIGVTLLLQIGPPPIKFGRRSVWDVVDLGRWLEDYKARGRAGKEFPWPVQKGSPCDKITTRNDVTFDGPPSRIVLAS